MVKPVTIIVGGSGRGKTTSIRTLDPKRTLVFNTEYKPLPFKNKAFEKHNHYLKTADSLLDFLVALPKATDIDTVVIDSFSAWTDMLRKECELKYKGFERWNIYNARVGELFDLLKKSEKYTFLIGHDEVLESEEEGQTKRLKVSGKQWEGMCEKEAVCVLWATTAKDEEGKLRYVFQTQTNGVTSAKSPMGMFETFEIDNDLGFVVTKIKEYFEGDEAPKEEATEVNPKLAEVIKAKATK